MKVFHYLFFYCLSGDKNTIHYVPQAELPFTEGLEPNTRHQHPVLLTSCRMLLLSVCSSSWLVVGTAVLYNSGFLQVHPFFYHSTLALSSSEFPVGRDGFRQRGYVQ